MSNVRIYLALFALASIALNHLTIAKEIKNISLHVHKTPTCGCCKLWIDHINEQKISTTFEDLPYLDNVKTEFGIMPNYRSCHTAVSPEGYVFEGHVPAKFIKRFLDEEHDGSIGLSVPAMPLGSPGMEVGDRFMPYKVLLLKKDGTSEVYAEVSSYEEQF
ncbi:DUF411 domain-containing protein [Aestuariibacter salexigens]|uniref:DUF411 domain-containing protein n=1 Tax=Aestuariibacter salexigens TaxID=226010 RepID=UPI000421BF9C|nr:DUF411 domain-containing protein [Aestuariibacter salexigens]